jgi:hypothetical protein
MMEAEPTTPQRKRPVKLSLEVIPMAHVTPKRTLFKEAIAAKKKPVRITLRVNRSPRLLIKMKHRVAVACQIIQ